MVPVRTTHRYLYRRTELQLLLLKCDLQMVEISQTHRSGSGGGVYPFHLPSSMNLE
jgi:hypothetical protein